MEPDGGERWINHWVWNKDLHKYEYRGPNRIVIVIQALWEWLTVVIYFGWHRLTDRFRDEVI